MAQFFPTLDRSDWTPEGVTFASDNTDATSAIDCNFDSGDKETTTGSIHANADVSIDYFGPHALDDVHGNLRSEFHDIGKTYPLAGGLLAISDSDQVACGAIWIGKHVDLGLTLEEEDGNSLDCRTTATRDFTLATDALARVKP